MTKKPNTTTIVTTTIAAAAAMGIAAYLLYKARETAKELDFLLDFSNDMGLSSMLNRKDTE